MLSSVIYDSYNMTMAAAYTNQQVDELLSDDQISQSTFSASIPSGQLDAGCDSDEDAHAEDDSGSEKSQSETDDDSDSESDSSDESICQESWVTDGNSVWSTNQQFSNHYSADSPFIPEHSRSPSISPLSLPPRCDLVLHESSPRASGIRAAATLHEYFDGEDESDGDATDDEFVPSPRIQARKRRSYRPYPRSSPASSRRSRSTPSSPASSSGSSAPIPFSSRDTPHARNAQIILSPDEFDAALEEFLNSRSKSCPVACGYEQKRRRVPDMRRHMDTHLSEKSHEKWVCCGVPLDVAEARGIDTTYAYDFRGAAMAGGCQRGFSRRDALVRHLNKNKQGCAEDCMLYLLQLDQN